MNDSEKFLIVPAAFLIPVVDGLIYLGQRGTPPYQFYFSAVGGKAEKKGKGELWNKPYMIEKLGGHMRVSIYDRVAIEEGRELVVNTALREFWEEAFHDKEFPKLEERVFSDVLKIGLVLDDSKVVPDKKFECLFFLANVHRKDFSLSPRELKDFKPLVQINDESTIAAPTKYALEQLRFLEKIRYDHLQPYVGFNLTSQIPQFKFDRMRFTDMAGSIIAMRDQGIPFTV